MASWWIASALRTRYWSNRFSHSVSVSPSKMRWRASAACEWQIVLHSWSVSAERLCLSRSFLSSESRWQLVFTDRLQPIEGALELLRTLTLPYCVASSAPREKIELSLSLTGLLPYLQGRMYSSYDIEDWKPSPGLFIHSARSMGVHPHRCAVIEDSWPGIQAGLAAGMTVYAFQPRDSDPRIPSQVSIVHRLSELRPLLCSQSKMV